MEEILYYNELYDKYKNLLTNKQQEYFEDYYFNNLSLSEMAENYNVSRNAIYKQVQIVKDKLEEYEKCLELVNKSKKLEEFATKINNEELKRELISIL